MIWRANMDETTQNNTEQGESTGTVETQNGAMTRPWRPQDADKEIYKRTIRQRIQASSVSADTIFIPAKPKPSINDDGQKTVAVYARVSTKSTEQISSIENQTKYYTEKIEKTPNWELQEIYSDEGKSGTSMRKRTEFRRMIQDAVDKKMDLIVCASVSRFARNVSDCIEQVRVLKTANPSHPVGVYFETENIYTLDPESNQLLTVHAMLADWESANKSRRMILSYDQRICTGQYPVSDLLGYRHTKKGELIIEEEEAKTVKYIFLAYLYGYSCEEIAETLTEKARKTLRGRTDWNASMVKNIMGNERRWGDLNVRKTIVIDYVKGKTVKNNQIRDAAFVPHHHEGIVTPQVANAVKYISSSGKSVNGVPDLYVIDKGNLKGFVSICPAWRGIDNDTLLSVSKDVYSDDEYAEIEHLSKVLSGEEESKILSMTFAGYEVPYGAYFITNKTPTLTISNKTIKFNNACYSRLGNSKYVEILYHPILQIVAVRKCDEDTPNAIQWIDENGKQKQVSSASAFTKSIYDRTNWLHNYKFRLKGISRVRGNSKIILFYLDEPQILVGKNKAVATDEEATAQYIPYKNCENSTPAPKTAKRYAFPDKWADCSNFGISIPLKKKRDTVIGNINEEDIREYGIRVDNPLIGILPSREEIWYELDKLMASM